MVQSRSIIDATCASGRVAHGFSAVTWTGRQLPPNWQTLRRQRFELDRWTCVDCGHHDPTGRTLECDHIGHRDDHRLAVLRTRCTPCHARRTKQQAAAARAATPKATRPARPHPGLR